MPRAVARLPVSAPIAIVIGPKSSAISNTASEVVIAWLTAVSSWKDRPTITQIATIAPSTSASRAIGAPFSRTMLERRTGSAIRHSVPSSSWPAIAAAR